MKTTTPNVKVLLYGLCMLAVLYNCRTKDVSSLTPFTYTFKGMNDIKLPEVTPTTPVAVVTTDAKVTPSTAVNTVSSAVATISSPGQIPTVVQKALDDVSKAVSNETASQLVNKFTPEVIANFSTTGKLPESLKNQMDGIVSNPSMQAYLVSISLPTVDGKVVDGSATTNTGGRVGAADAVATVQADKATLAATGVADACTNAANSAYNAGIQNLNVSRDNQLKAITAAYNEQVRVLNGTNTTCRAAGNNLSGLAAVALQQYNAQMQQLNAIRPFISAAQYNQMAALYLAIYTQQVSAFNNLIAAQTAACTTAYNTGLANAQNAQTQGTNQVNTNYNAALTTLNAQLAQAIAACHNQGSGR